MLVVIDIAVIETPPGSFGIELSGPAMDYDLYALVFFIIQRVTINYIGTGPRWFANQQVIFILSKF